MMGDEMSKDRDCFTLDGAIAMADQIKRLWHEKGKSVNTRVETIDIKLGGRDKPLTLYQVRSDMLNGLPSR
jgi:hypothetical protein